MTTPRTFIASSSCVAIRGGVPIMADIDAERPRYLRSLPHSKVRIALRSRRFSPPLCASRTRARTFKARARLTRRLHESQNITAATIEKAPLDHTLPGPALCNTALTRSAGTGDHAEDQGNPCRAHRWQPVRHRPDHRAGACARSGLPCMQNTTYDMRHATYTMQHSSGERSVKGHVVWDSRCACEC